MVATAPARLPLFRGTEDGADCGSCPFSTNGQPTKPVYSEFPADPKWILLGEGPGFNEVRLGRPFVGASGDVVNKLLAKIGRPRPEIFVGNATLCKPPDKSPEADRQRAASACSGRLAAELAQFPGKPILTLGAVAARALIPKDVLEAIDPPDAQKQIKRGHKIKSSPTLKAEISRRKTVKKETDKQLKKLLAHERKRVITEIKFRHKQRPTENFIQQELSRVHAKLLLRARELAIKTIDLRIKERALKKLTDAAKPKKPKKAKPVKITDIVGTLFDLDIAGPRALIPGIHPAALLRGGGASIGGSHTPDMAYVNLIYDAAKIDSLAHGKDIRLAINVEYELFDHDNAVRLFLLAYNEALVEDSCSIDLETYVDDGNRHHALMAYVAKIRVIGISTSQRSVSLAWELLPPICQTLLRVLLMRCEVGYHNGLYDRTVLRAHGFVMGPRWFDTLLAHHAAFPGNSHKLQTVGAQFYGLAPWKSEFRNAEETPEKLAIYNAKDTGVTHALKGPLLKMVSKTKTERVYDLDKQMSDAASAMHLAGMPVDRDVNQELLTTFTKTVVESKRSVEDIARDPKKREEIWHHLAIQQAGKKRKLDPDDYEQRYQIRLEAMRLDPDWKWKIGSGKHIAALCLAMGLPMVDVTAGGDVSTKKEVLEGLVEHQVIRQILDYRESDKLLSTFVTPIFDRFDGLGNITQYGYADANSRIHPIWNVHRISGRWASAWPVVSNVPKDKWKKLVEDALLAIRAQIEMGLQIKGPTLVDGTWLRVNKDGSIAKMVRPNLRRQIRVQRKGRKLVGFDYAQIEARVIALISGDPFLMEVFADPTRDIHNECAAVIWEQFYQLDPDTRKGLRENVKNIEYGYMYMAQLDTLHNTMLKAGNMIKKPDLARAIAKLATLMPKVKIWQQSTIAQALKPPFEIRDFLLGRRRVWPMGNVEAPEAINFSVQPVAAAIMNTGMSRMMPRLVNYNEVDPCAQIHDAAFFEVWEDDVERFKVDCKEAFEQEYTRDGRTIRFTIDLKVGDDWSQV